MRKLIELWLQSVFQQVQDEEQYKVTLGQVRETLSESMNFEG